MRYDYPLDGLVHRLKYRGDLACGRVLGRLLARALQRRGEPPPDAIIPIPLARARYRLRGFNQAHELALPVSAGLGAPIRADLVIRQRDTQEQAGLKQRDRRRNVRRAFALTQPLDMRHVAIVDDVLTTGSTANELAKLLRRSGATTVEVWVAARAGGPRPGA